MPIDRIGLSAVIGSWETIDIRCPRIARSSCSDFDSKSEPSKIIAPLVTCALLATNPMMLLISVDFPQPLSPTTPTIAPLGMVRSTSRSAFSVPLSVTNPTLRLVISRIFALATQASLRSLGSNTSRRLSPRKVNPNVVRITGIPPAITGHGLL